MIDFTYASGGECIASGERCLIFGAGNIGRELLGIFLRNGVETVRFLDCSPERRGWLEGIPVSTPEEVPPEERQLPVFIAVFSHPHHCSTATITSLLVRNGFGSVTDFETLYRNHSGWFSEPHLWLAGADFFRARREEIEQARRLFSDVRSLEIYDAQINHRLGAPYTVLPDPEPVEEQYWPPDIPVPGNGCTLVDIGAFDGDTIASARLRGIRPSRIFAFEPDMNNFSRLCDRISKLEDWGVEIHACPAGCGDRIFTAAALSGNGTSSSALSAGEEGTIPIAPLDRMLHRVPVDYIKMDTEGFEEPCLLGMRETLARYRPALAVSTYHRPQDVFALPLLIAKFLPGCRFHLRVYGEHGFETVLYAIPDRFTKSARKK